MSKRKITVSKTTKTARTAKAKTPGSLGNRVATLEEVMIGGESTGKKSLILLKPFVIRKAVRSNISDEDLCREYNCSHEELENKILQFYPHDGSEIIDDLKRNGKFKPSSKRATPKKTQKDTITPPAKDPVETAKENISKYDVKDLPKSIAALQEEKIFIQSQKDIVYAAMNEEMPKWNAKKEEISDLEAKIARIKRSLEEKETALRQAMMEGDKLGNNHITFEESCKAADCIMEAIDNRIKEVDKATIFIYLDGKFEVDKDHENIALNDEGADEIRKKIVVDDLIVNSDISIKSIRLIARVIQIIKNYEGKMDFEFEDEALDKEARSILGSL